MFHVKHFELLTHYPENQDKLTKYATWLETEGLTRGLIGPREVDRIWDRHISNCAVVSEVIADGASIIDIGSGAGLPGIVLAIVMPNSPVTLIEPLLRRSEFLSEIVADLGLSNVTVVRARAEQVGNLKAEVVTARAVAPLFKLIGWAMPLVAKTGELLAMKGSNAPAEIAQAKAQLAGKSVEIVQAGVGVIDPPTTLVRIKNLA